MPFTCTVKNQSEFVFNQLKNTCQQHLRGTAAVDDVITTTGFAVWNFLTDFHNLLFRCLACEWTKYVFFPQNTLIFKCIYPVITWHWPVEIYTLYIYVKLKYFFHVRKQDDQDCQPSKKSGARTDFTRFILVEYFIHEWLTSIKIYKYSF